MDEEQFQEQLAQLESTVKQRMSKEAVSRLGNIKTAHPEKAIQAMLLLAQALQKKQISHIDDTIFKQVLQSLAEKKDTIIKRV